MDQHGHIFPFSNLNLTLSGISIGGICTSLQIREASLCLDCGVLSPTAIRMANMALTHAHVDHAGGLITYLGNRRLMHFGPSTIYTPPAISEQIRTIIDLWENLQGSPFESEVIPASPGSFYDIGPRLCLRPFSTQHTIPSQGYTLVRKKYVLRRIKKLFCMVKYLK